MSRLLGYIAAICRRESSVVSQIESLTYRASFEEGKLSNIDSIYYYLSDGDVTRYEHIKKMNAVDAYKNLYMKRLESLNKKINTLEEIKYSRKK